MALPVAQASAAQPRVGLGTAESFALLSGSAVTNTGPSVLNGDLGISPGTALTGWPPGIINGNVQVNNAVALNAQSDLTIAYNDAAGRTPALAVSADLGGLTLTSGVYKAASELGLTGTVTLDAQNNPDAVFILQVGSALTTASDSTVKLINGAQPCNVFWQIGSSATLGTRTQFVGRILALTSVSMNDAVTVNGAALARNGSVTLINDRVTAAACAAPPTTPPPTTPPTDTPPTDTPPTTPTGTTPTGTTPTGTTPTGTTPTGTSPTGTTPTVTRPTGIAPAGTPGATPTRGTPGAGQSGGQNGSAVFTTKPRRVATSVARSGTERCINKTFRASVTGLRIRRVVFSIGERVIATRGRAPYEALIAHKKGVHTLLARVTFTDGTRSAKLKMRFRSCAAAKRQAEQGPRAPIPGAPVGFTG